MRKQLGEIVSILRGAALEKPLQSIISDLEDKKEEVRGGGGLERGWRRESGRGERESSRRKVKTRTKPLPASLLDSSSSSLTSIRAGQKYQGKTRGRREEEEERRRSGRREEEEDRRRGGRREDKPACDCAPVLERIGKTIEKDR